MKKRKNVNSKLKVSHVSKYIFTNKANGKEVSIYLSNYLVEAWAYSKGFDFQNYDDIQKANYELLDYIEDIYPLGSGIYPTFQASLESDLLATIQIRMIEDQLIFNKLNIDRKKEFEDISSSLLSSIEFSDDSFSSIGK